MRRLDPEILRRVDAAIRDLANDPRPHGYAKMHGDRNLFRIRVGDWRVIYAIRDQQLIVLVMRIGHRGDVYRTK